MIHSSNAAIIVIILGQHILLRIIFVGYERNIDVFISTVLRTLRPGNLSES